MILWTVGQILPDSSASEKQNYYGSQPKPSALASSCQQGSMRWLNESPSTALIIPTPTFLTELPDHIIPQPEAQEDYFVRPATIEIPGMIRYSA